MFFAGVFSFTVTNAIQKIGIGIGVTFFLWLFLTSTMANVLPQPVQLFRIIGSTSQLGVLEPDYRSRVFYILMGGSVTRTELADITDTARQQYKERMDEIMGINIENLVMEYKKGVKSLDHINLNIDQGIYGLLGENGAGKSTLMKILVTLLTPTEGTVEINGIRLEKKNYELIKKEIGYLPQELGLYPNLTVRESLEYVGIMSGTKEKRICGAN